MRRLQFPEHPTVPEQQRVRSTEILRYEDVCQDGRVAVLGLPHAIGMVWRERLLGHPLSAAAQSHGIVPILFRLQLEATEEPITIAAPAICDGGFELAHSTDGAGNVERLFLNVWTDLSGTRGRLRGPPPPGAGETVLAGRIFAEHILTRPFAPPDQRRVTELSSIGGDLDLGRNLPWTPLEEVAALPFGGRWLEDEAVDDAAPVVFGLQHTDSNQHVNSLVYPRLFEEAVIRRFASAGLPADRLARRVTVGYRKPSFVSEELRLSMRLFEVDGRRGAVGAFRAPPAGDRPAESAPRCYLKMIFG